MKIFRFIAIAIALASLIVLPSCVQTEFDVMPEYVTGINVTAELPDFSKFDDSITKVDYSLSGSNINFSWSEEGDILGIYPVGGEQVAFPLSGTTGGASANFDGGAWALRTSYDYAAYYPFSSDYYAYDETRLPVSYLGQKQTGNESMSHLGAYSYMAAMATTPDSNGSVNLKMKQLGAWILIKAYVPEGMSVGNVTLTDMTSNLIVGGSMDLTQSASSADAFAPTLVDPVYSPSISLAVEDLTAGTSQLQFWMMLPPQNLLGHDLRLDITSPGGSTSVSSVIKGKNITRAGGFVLNFGTFEAPEADYLCVAAETAGVSVQFKLESESNAWASSSTVFDLEYSMDGENWNTCFFNRNYTLANVGDKIYFRGDNDSFSVVPDQYIHFVTTGPVAVGGNIMTLLDKSGLSETIPGEYTFVSLFKNAAITSAPSLPATTLAYGCYYYMFYGCTLLEKAPALPATTLAKYCYSSMFSGCTALTEAPVLPAAVMEEGCYTDMFVGCSSLEKSPALPAMTLAQQCYSGMFGGCTSLKEAPALPATTLAASCYMAMFAHCTSLTTAPVLPATTLADLCYLSMFLECSSLSRIEVAFSEWVGHTLPTSIWCASVPQGGTFVCPSDLDIKFGDDFIPEGWSVQHSDESTTTPDYLSFTAEMPNSTVGMEVHGDNWTLPALQYSTDMKSWKAFNIGSTTITLPHIGDKVYFRGDNSSFSVSTSASVRFVMTGKIAASGNIMTLVDKSGRSRTIPNNYAFISLFTGCSSLTKAPSLPATSLKNYSYYCMFENCTSLTAAPELPATELADGCYAAMFNGCTSLTEAPELPATTLKRNCYSLLFQNCSSLRKVKVSFTDWNESGTSTSNWLFNVAPSGEFIAPDALPAIYDDDHIPSSWAPDYLCFTASRANVTIGMEVNGDNWTVPSLEYSRDKVNWYEFVPGTTTVTLQNVNDKVYFRGDNRTFSVGSGKYVRFTMSNGDSSYEASVAASGNIMSLVDKTCTSTTIPNSYAFQYLFDHCILMTSAPSLPATTLTEGCYNWMFGECNALSSAPALPATTLAKSCYNAMFMNCSGLTSAPSLPATTMAEGCYSHMFYGTRLTSAPALPATTLAKNCYMEMFLGNPFTTAPSLPATTLAEGCYDEMFSGCTSLVTGPRIYAQTLAPSSCYGMFSGCSSLSSLEVDFTAWDNTAGVNNATHFWMANVPSTGTFKCPEALPATRDASHIPSSWAVQNPDITSSTRNYLCFTASSANVTIGMEVLGDNWTVPSLELSPDGVNWYEFIPGSTSNLFDDVDNQVFFRGNNDTFSVSDSKYVRFVMSSNGPLGGIVYASGNVMSLVDKTCTSTTIPNSYAFAHLFENCSNLDCADSELLPAMTLAESCYKDMFFRSGIYFAPSLPATTLAEGCYSSMFGSCGNLTVSPSLPATTLTKSCYASMFAYSGLNTAPALSATTLAESCYSGMFESCGSLTSVPNDYLPVTTLAKSCYEKMFMSCSGLTSAPSLPATTMEERSYYAMFYGCNNLASAPTLPATTLAKYCYSEMFFACQSLTAAPTLPALRFAEGCYDSMFLYCTALESAGINATGRLPKNCCAYMFYGCSSLNRLGVVFERWDPTEGIDNATYKWVDGVSSTGTFVCPIDLPTSVRDENHIPLNWSIVHPRIEL